MRTAVTAKPSHHHHLAQIALVISIDVGTRYTHDGASQDEEACEEPESNVSNGITFIISRLSLCNYRAITSVGGLSAHPVALAALRRLSLGALDEKGQTAPSRKKVTRRSASIVAGSSGLDSAMLQALQVVETGDDALRKTLEPGLAEFSGHGYKSQFFLEKNL